jgi:hypothetical protein
MKVYFPAEVKVKVACSGAVGVAVLPGATTSYMLLFRTEGQVLLKPACRASRQTSQAGHQGRSVRLGIKADQSSWASRQSEACRPRIRAGWASRHAGYQAKAA